MRLSLCCVLFLSTCFAQTASPTSVKQKVLWQKLESSIQEVDQHLDGVMGVAIEDLTTGDHYFLHEDEVFAQASSIKITVLANLYLQEKQGKLKLTDLYTVQSSDLVQDSDIMNGLTPGVTRVTLRDLATMMVAVSDNAATNVLIDRIGLPNVNAMLDSLGLAHTRLRRKMMDLGAGQGGPGEYLFSARDDDAAGRDLPRQTAEQRLDCRLLQGARRRTRPRGFRANSPADLKIANKPENWKRYATIRALSLSKDVRT